MQMDRISIGKISKELLISSCSWHSVKTVKTNKSTNIDVTGKKKVSLTCKTHDGLKSMT